MVSVVAVAGAKSRGEGPQDGIPSASHYLH